MEMRVGDLVRPTIHRDDSTDREIGLIIEVKKEAVSGVSLATVKWTTGCDSDSYRIEPIVSQSGHVLLPEIEIISESR